MLAIVYMSRAKQPFNGKDLLELLNKARINNARLQISGLLLYKDGEFMQVLEGDDEAVNAKMAQIARDPRHTDVTIIVNEHVETRRFAHYAMGFVHIDSVRPDRRELVGPWLAEPLFSERYRHDPEKAWTLLLSFKGTFK